MIGRREITCSEFGTPLTRVGGASRVPSSGSIEIVFRCNLRCVHCHLADCSGHGEMTLSEITRIPDEMAGEGRLWLLLTGGEIHRRRDFPEISMHAKRLGFLSTTADRAPGGSSRARRGEPTMRRHKSVGGRKRRYEPPQLTRVRLVPDEAVPASRKNNATAVPTGSAKKCAGPPAMCSHNAS